MLAQNGFITRLVIIKFRDKLENNSNPGVAPP